MRNCLVPAVVAGVVLALGCPVWAQDEPKAVIEKAIKAYGGADKLAKLQAMKVKSKGKVSVAGNDVDFTVDTAIQLPSQFKNTVEIDVMGNKFTVVQVFDGKTGWMSIMGNTTELQGNQLDEMKATGHNSRVNMLTPLLKDKGFELSSLGDVKVNGKEAAGIKVSYKGQKDISLFFDKTTWLAVKTERRMIDDATQQEVLQETFVSEFKDVDGLKMPSKVVIHRDGKKFMEGEVTETKLVEKIDASEFAKP